MKRSDEQSQGWDVEAQTLLRSMWEQLGPKLGLINPSDTWFAWPLIGTSLDFGYRPASG